MRIQHNITAMNAYRNYSANTNAVAKNLEKLSSGYRINRAGDDAAGLAISEKMRAQISGLTAAQKNVKDGISLVKTAEGATQEIHDMLNRMVTLAEQSANGTYQDAVDREAIVNEFEALKTEINRIADSSNFNGIKLLDGSLDSSVKVANAKNVDVTPTADGQLGKEAQPGIYSIDLSKIKMSADSETVTLEAFGLTADADVSSGMTDEQIAKALADSWNTDNADNWDGDAATEYGEGFTMNAKAEGSKIIFTMSQAPNKAFAEADTKATLTFDTDDVTNNNAQQITLTQVQEAVDSSMGRMYAQGEFALKKDTIVKDGGTLTIGDETYVFAVGADSTFKGMANVVDLTDKTMKSDDLLKAAANRLSGVAANNSRFKVGSDNNGTISLTEKEGGVDYSVNNLAGKDGKGTIRNAAAAASAPAAVDSKKTDWAGLVKTGTVDVGKMGKGLTLQIGEDSASYNQLSVSVSDMHTKALGLDGLSLGTQAGAQKALSTINDAINLVSQTRGRLGATQNRLEHTSNNLSVMKENIQDAESAIRDTDIAEEMMAYTKNSILVQSAQAMLAQANQIPQGVLQLLG